MIRLISKLLQISFVLVLFSCSKNIKKETKPQPVPQIGKENELSENSVNCLEVYEKLKKCEENPGKIKKSFLKSCEQTKNTPSAFRFFYCVKKYKKCTKIYLCIKKDKRF
jgi:hypothetical protein